MRYKTDSIHQLPPHVNARLCAVSQRRTLARGEVLLSPGSASDMLFGVISGAVSTAMYAESGKKFGTTVWTEGHWFGESHLLSKGLQPFFAEAVEISEVAVIDDATFRQLITTDPEVLLHLATLAASRYMRLLSWVEHSVLRPLPERIALLLCASSERRHNQQRLIRASQDSMADCLGVSRQSINKCLKSWEKLGLIDIFYGSIVIKDETGLLAAARQQPDCNETLRQAPELVS
jgi:CRP/FNR family transcriptional regulator, cyclic AMP receptor protein